VEGQEREGARERSPPIHIPGYAAGVSAYLLIVIAIYIVHNYNAIIIADLVYGGIHWASRRWL